MFGYIRPVEDELYVKDLTLYRAVYCGMCKYGGKRISRLTRFFLNYDFVLLALLRLSLGNAQTDLIDARCPYKLTKHKMFFSDEVYAHVCSCFAILTYLNNEDDIADGGGLKPRVLRPLLKHMCRKTKGYEGFYERTLKHLCRLSEIEKANSGDIDAAANCFALILSDAASMGLEGISAEIARQCGLHLGRFVYLIDAYDDLADDAHKGSYNPFLCRYGSVEAALEHKNDIETTLVDSVNAFSAVYGLAGKTEFDRLIYNISELGGRHAVFKISKEYSQ